MSMSQLLCVGASDSHRAPLSLCYPQTISDPFKEALVTTSPFDRSRLAPEVEALLTQMQANPGSSLYSLTPTEARRAAANRSPAVTGEPEQVADVANTTIPGPAGPVPIRIYRPAAAEACGVLMYFHGGCWVICNLDTHDIICRALANRGRCVVVSVDYRLAPEHPYPAGLDDCWAATQWAAANPIQLKGIPDALAVAGDSAGGNLAAAVALRARDSGGPQLAHQLLIYPITDVTRFDTPSYIAWGELDFLTRPMMEWTVGLYTPDPAVREHGYVSPLHADDLSNLPPAHVITAECDILCDEGDAYAARLIEAGVEVCHRRYDGLPHGFLGRGGAIGKTAEVIEAIGRQLRRYLQ
jgi:acetyl esterase